jgi:hypothetical protein
MNDVRRQLVVNGRNGRILKWHDRKIPPGSEWRKQIDDRLREARIRGSGKRRAWKTRPSSLAAATGEENGKESGKKERKRSCVSARTRVCGRAVSD